VGEVLVLLEALRMLKVVALSRLTDQLEITHWPRSLLTWSPLVLHDDLFHCHMYYFPYYTFLISIPKIFSFRFSLAKWSGRNAPMLCGNDVVQSRRWRAL
jgi:hypothetical protein